ncbi:MAG: hypothetical protein HYZ48_04075 [Chlamydiales bacterium]|nr:hypothetical protein [Chlamydiales bacterium]
MIGRFFKKKPKKEESKKMSSKPEEKKRKSPSQKILTAEGWKRLMMRKYAKGKK